MCDKPSVCHCRDHCETLVARMTDCGQSCTSGQSIEQQLDRQTKSATIWCAAPGGFDSNTTLVWAGVSAPSERSADASEAWVHRLLNQCMQSLSVWIAAEPVQSLCCVGQDTRTCRRALHPGSQPGRSPSKSCIPGTSLMCSGNPHLDCQRGQSEVALGQLKAAIDSFSAATDADPQNKVNQPHVSYHTTGWLPQEIRRALKQAKATYSKEVWNSNCSRCSSGACRQRPSAGGMGMALQLYPSLTKLLL